MKYHLKINSLKTVDEIKDHWTTDDYLQLLEKFNFPDAGTTKKETLHELLLMAITDFEPKEAAIIVLTHKLGEILTEGQIEQISNDMLIDTVCEEYPEIELQYALFNCNQLLYKAFNGIFPSANATIIDCSITPIDKNSDIKITKEILLKLFGSGLSNRNILKRLFGDQMDGNAAFPEAEGIVWELKTTDNLNFSVTTSANLLKDADFNSLEFEAEFEVAEN
ncbi:MAG: hypothetical protein CVU08_13570 [Bacteroidetes bacterium HGW-Bacteroidetes-3]|jgi:hypothetical protein|nr:MAG: hypothetical protein CVU08_13570 [Bacteroidetes bacterium HGW-Bacteroidetes-3]